MDTGCTSNYEDLLITRRLWTQYRTYREAGCPEFAAIGGAVAGTWRSTPNNTSCATPRWRVRKRLTFSAAMHRGFPLRESPSQDRGLGFTPSAP